MVSYLKLLFICLTLALLSACNSIHYHDPSMDVDSFKEGDKGAVVFSLKATKFGIFSDSIDVVDQFVVSRIDPNYFNEDNRLRYKAEPKTGFLFVDTSDPYNVLMLKPGLYVLEGLRMQDGNVTYYSVGDGLRVTRKYLAPKFGWFKVKKGEVAYIGNLNISLKAKDKYKLSYTNEYQDAVAFFKKQFPAIKQPVKKRLISKTPVPRDQFYKKKKRAKRQA